MALTSGLAGQFGFEKESTPGTYEAPTHFLEFLDESIKLEIEQVSSNGIRAGRRTKHNITAGAQVVRGSSTHELTTETTGGLLELCFGAVNTTGASDPWTHTFTPGDLASGTVQVGTPGTGGTVHPRSYTGMKVSAWELTVDPSTNFVILRIDWVGQAETTAESLETASYSTFTRVTFKHATFSLGGSEVCVDQISIRGDNALDVNNKVCSTNPGYPTISEAGMRSYTGTATADFADLTQYNRYKNATEVAFSLALAVSANDDLTITGNVHFMGETPNVTGAEVLKQPIPFEFVHATSDASAITAVLKNGDSAV